MVELQIKLPKELEEDKEMIEKRIKELIIFETKRKALLEFIKEVMKGAKQLSDEELVKFGREIKKGRFEELKKQGLVDEARG